MNGIYVARWIALGVILLLTPAGQAIAADVCAAPPDLTANVAAMPRLAEVLKPGGNLSVLTVGSATVFSPMESLQPGSVTGRALGLGDTPRTGALPEPVGSGISPANGPGSARSKPRADGIRRREGRSRDGGN